MKIEKIKKLKGGKYKIELDSGKSLEIHDNVILENNLLFNCDLTSSLINKINNENEYYDLYNQCIKMISRRLRSTKEVIMFLEKKEVPKERINKLTAQLENIGLLNDKAFAKAFILDKLNLSNDGLYKIKKLLKELGIDEKIILEETSKINDEDIKDKVIKLINKKLKSSKGSSYNIREKIYRDLINLGYSKDMIDSCYQADIDESTSIEKDYDKYYKKYLRKEEGDKLYLIVRQKLYSLGYSVDSINDIINKKRVN